MAQLEFYFDYSSPYSYLANSQIPALAERTGAEVLYRPVLNGAVVVAAKNTPPPAVPAKARYLGVDIPRWVRRYGVPFDPNPQFPANYTQALRGALVALDDGAFFEYHEGCMRAMWAEARDLEDPRVIGEIATSAGLDATSLLERTSDPAVKERLKSATDAAVARGMFGVPTFYIGDEMFFGNDRLDFVEEALRGA